MRNADPVTAAIFCILMFLLVTLMFVAGLTQEQKQVQCFAVGGTMVQGDCVYVPRIR
mgnify:CR=1 FL=1